MKKHATIIHETKDFSLFLRHPSNPASRTADNALIQSMRDYGWWDWLPAVVVPKNGGFVLQDGHRRFDAARKAEVTVKYVIATQEVAPAIISYLNHRWSIGDFVESYAQQGIKAFDQVREFANRYGVTLSTALVCLTGNNLRMTDITTGKLNDSILAGKFKASFKYASKIAEILLAVRGMGPSPRFSWWQTNRFVRALCAILRNVDDFEPDYFIQKIAKYHSMLDIQASTQQYVQMVERIYNYRRPGDKLSIADPVEKARDKYTRGKWAEWHAKNPDR